MKLIKKSTDPQEELLIEVDKNNKVIGKISRKTAHNSPSKYYRTIYVIVKNSDGLILLQKRSATKDLYPNCWDLSVGGHVNFGQSYLETAIRELKEELNISISNKDLKLLGELLVKLPTSNEYFNVFEYILKNTDDIKIETNELSQTKWMSVGDIKKSIKNNPSNWYPRPTQVITAFLL